MSLDIPSLTLCSKYSEKLCKILQQVLKIITPTPELKRYMLGKTEIFLNEVRKVVERYNIDASIEAHGSFVRDTWLAQNREVDVFILFNKQLSRDEIVRILNIFEKELPWPFEKTYAQHPYLRFKVDDVTFELVPGFRVGKIISAVDRTPAHTAYLKRKLTDALKAEIRLFKAFLKGIFCYGAEIEVQGLSGYATEVLTVIYGSFLKTLEEFSQNKRIFIDPTETWVQKDVLRKFNTPIVLIDPVDPNRNTTAALSWETYNRISLASKLFLARPSMNYFFPKINTSHINRLTHAIKKFSPVVVELKLEPNVVKETYWGQARRIAKEIIEFLRREQYRPLTYLIIEVSATKTILIFIFLQELESFYVRFGPPINADINRLLSFMDKWKEEGIGPLIGRRVRFVLKRKEDVIGNVTNLLRQVKIKPSFNSFSVHQFNENMLNQLSEKELIKLLIQLSPLSLWLD